LLQLYCYNNQLTALPDLTSNTALQEIRCISNQLTVLPDLTNNTALWYLDFRFSKLDFSDARELRIADAISTLATYVYSPQNPFGIPDTFNLNMGDTLILSIANQDSALSYQWYRGIDTIVGAIDTLLIIPNVTLAESGVYTCRSYGTALDNPPMIFGPGINSFVSEGFLVNINMPPVANNDTASTTEDVTIVIDVQANDNDPNGDPLITFVDQNPTNGKAIVLNNESIQYDPDSLFIGTDTVTYWVCDNGTPALCDTAIVIVTVTPQVGIGEGAILNSLNIYPNPNTGVFTITFDIKIKQHINLKIFNIEGKVIYEEDLNEFTGLYSKEIDLSAAQAGMSSYAKGIYNLQLIYNEGRINKKIILE